MTFTGPSRLGWPTDVALWLGAALLVLALGSGSALAKSSDRNQPVQVSAQSFDALAKPNGVSHLNGDVVITQGSLKVTGANAIIYFDANSQVRRVVVTGAPATLRQLDDSNQLITGHAQRIDYDITQAIATLTGDAFVKQAGRGSVSGQKLVYNTRSSAMNAHSEGSGRVHLTFKPRPAAAASAQPAAAASTVQPTPGPGGH